MIYSIMYHEGNRWLQDQFESCWTPTGGKYSRTSS